MKKICFILLICCFVLGFARDVYADRNKSSFSTRTTSGLIKRGDWKIYRITFIATTNAGNFAIYDELLPQTVAQIKAEGREATANNSEFYDFTEKPLEGSTGLYLEITTGIAIIEYE